MGDSAITNLLGIAEMISAGRTHRAIMQFSHSASIPIRLWLNRKLNHYKVSMS